MKILAILTVGFTFVIAVIAVTLVLILVLSPGQKQQISDHFASEQTLRREKDDLLWKDTHTATDEARYNEINKALKK